MDETEKSFHKFLLLWAGNFVSSVGSGLTSFGLGVYIFKQTGRASLMALVTLLAFLPSLLLSVPAGVLADRYDRRILMVLGDSLSALGLLYILLCLMQGEAQIWQICVGVTVSSVFASLLEPAYKSTITDLLTAEQFSKASGLVQLAGSAKYLLSPVLAGFLLGIADIRLLLIIDICTFFVTVSTTLVVRKGLTGRSVPVSSSMASELREGFRGLTEKKGVFLLAAMGSAITFCLGVVQTLASPMVLSFSNSTVLGTMMTVVALGMLVSSFILGSITIKKGYSRLLASSLLAPESSWHYSGFGKILFLSVYLDSSFLPCCRLPIPV